MYIVKEPIVEAINRIEKTYRRLLSEGREMTPLFSGNPNDCGFHFPKEILGRAYTDYFSSPDYRPDPKGLPEARESIARYYRDHDVPVDSENVILTSGTSESFFSLFSFLAQPGDEILSPVPSYPLFDPIAKMNRVRLVPYHLDEHRDWSIDLEDLQRKTTPKTRAIIIISPHNPTGMVASADELKRIAQWANAKEIPLICDEVFSEFYFGEGTFPRVIGVTRPDLCFTLNGISKMFALPALKLGWIAVTGESDRVEEAVDHLETTADTFLSVHTPIQKALPILFSEGRGFLKNYRREVRDRRGLALRILNQCPSLRVVPPAGGSYLTAEITQPIPLSEEDFVIRLMEEEGVFVHPGYFYDDEKGVHFVISFLAPREILRPSLQKIGDFVSRHLLDKGEF